ncbi:MAG: DUF3618 domain-containing protein [Solirubrobacteraceae bacterium]
MATQDPGSEQESKTPEEIRAEIEQTRNELGDTVEALGAKTDVKGRAQDKVDEMKTSAQDKVEELKTTVQDKMPGAGASDGRAAGTGEPSGPQVQAQAAMDKARANPLPVAVAVALLLGYLIGRRRGE